LPSLQIFRNSGSLNGSESGGDFFPAKFSPLPDPATAEINSWRGKERRTMNPLIQSKTIIVVLIAGALACTGFLPKAEAVVPAPDGGYPNFTTAEGTNALQSLTTGSANTAVGWFSLFSNTDGSFNTGVGAGTLLFNVGDQNAFEGVQNTAIGAAALLFNTTGSTNVAVGTAALLNNASGNWNNAIGAFALHDNIDGFNNNALGQAALFKNIHGSDNTAVGDSALLNNDITGNALGNFNTAVGSGALFSNTDGDSNTAVGAGALLSNTEGINNTANGAGALFNNTTIGMNSGHDNTADGLGALHSNTTGPFNTATGSQALFSNTTAGNNTAVGFQALLDVTGFSGNNTAVGSQALVLHSTGSANIGLGAFAGSALTNGSLNIYIGNVGVAAESGTIRIGAVGSQAATFIAGISGATVTGTPVVVDANGQLGVAPSSQRFKDEIKPMDKASEAILALQPVTFRYKKEIDPKSVPQFGLVAEDVEKVDPDLVVRDREGKPYSVRYDQVNAMLLNEFLKEHKAFLEEQRKVREQEATITALESKMEKQEAIIAQQQAKMETVLARLNEQTAQIQNVSAQIGLSKSVTKVAEAGR
jgi:trimeric autotransporter adhesin